MKLTGPLTWLHRVQHPWTHASNLLRPPIQLIANSVTLKTLRIEVNYRVSRSVMFWEQVSRISKWWWKMKESGVDNGSGRDLPHVRRPWVLLGRRRPHEGARERSSNNNISLERRIWRHRRHLHPSASAREARDTLNLSPRPCLSGSVVRDQWRNQHLIVVERHLYKDFHVFLQVNSIHSSLEEERKGEYHLIFCPHLTAQKMFHE